MEMQHVIQFMLQRVHIPFYANEFPKIENGDCGFVRIDSAGSPDIDIIGLKTPSIQVGIRHRKGSEAEKIAKTVWKLFHGKEHYFIGTTKVYFSSCDQSEPIYVGVDNNGRTIYSVNVTCKTVD